MFAKLKGLVDGVGEDFAVIDVQGVGYLVQCSARTLRTLPAVGEAVALAIETQVREDAIRLYGFQSEAERDWFRLLQGVQGVGAKVALGILSVLDGSALATAIGTGDKGMLGRAPGVGPKLAARIAAELRDKSPSLSAIDPDAARLAGAIDARAAPKPVADAVSALVNLGYGQAQAASAVAAASRSLGEGAETAALIRAGLKEMAR